MINIFPLARSKRVKSISDALKLHGKDNIIVQEYISGISCHVIAKEKEVKVFNRIGFDITKKIKNKEFYKDLSSIALQENEFHFLAIIKANNIVVYDCLSLGKKKFANKNLLYRIDAMNSLSGDLKNISLIKTFNISNLDDLIDLNPKKIVFKFKNSKYPIKNLRSKEPIAKWYTFALTNKLYRDVIVDSFYTGSKKSDLIFRCKQYSKGKLIQVGKIRIESKKERDIIVSSLKKRKKIVCTIEIEKFDSLGRFKKLKFVSRKLDKPFRSVLVDSERIAHAIEIINMKTKKIDSFEM